MIEVARIEAREGGDLVQTIAQRVAVDRQAGGGRRDTAVLGEEHGQGLEQLRLVVERTQEVGSQGDLRAFVGYADERGHAEGVEAVDLVRTMEAAAQRERRAGVLVRASQPAQPGVV